jgi:hypothetical protein
VLLEESVERRNTVIGTLVASLLLVIIFISLLTIVQPPFSINAQVESSSSTVAGTNESALFTIDPPRQGRFISAGEKTTFRVPILNNGIVPTDIYELEVSSTWPVSVFGSDGNFPLTDTNGSGNIDTGEVHQGQTFNVVVEMNVPVTATVNVQNNAEITITSWVNPGVTQTTYLQAAIPAPFVQAFRDHANGAMSLLFAEPNANWLKKQTNDSYNGTGAAIAELPMGYIYTWSKSRLINGSWNTEIEYLLTDKSGSPFSEIFKLTDHSTSPLPIHDIKPVVALTPEGVIGVAWHRQIFSDKDVVNHNIYLALLDQSGKVIYGPSNITLNSGWVTPTSTGIPSFDSPRIAGTGDERFFLAWHSYLEEIDGSVRDIFYTVRGTNGEKLVDNTNFTNDLPDDIGYSSPTVAAVTPNRVVLAWVQRRPVDDDVFYAVLDSNGNIIKDVRNLSRNEREIDWLTLDSVELSDGNILIAWKAWGCSEHEYAGRIKYAILGAQYNRTGQPVCLGDPGIAATGDWGVSVAADSDGNAIITWTDEDQFERHHFYYALVDGKLNIITQPMIFHRTETPPFSTSYEGYAITSRLYVDGKVAFGNSNYHALSDQTAKVSVNFGNQGTMPVSSATLTVTIDTGLTYESDTATVIPDINGNKIVWTYSELGPNNNQRVDIFLSMSESGEPGIAYPLTATIKIDEPDFTLDNNQDQSQVTFYDNIIYIPMATTATD